MTDNKTFWRTIKSYFNEKDLGSDKIIALSGNESVLTNGKKCKYYKQLRYKHRKTFKFKASYNIKCNGHRANNLSF